MGAWSVSINGNDTAADLRQEYQAAFSRLSPEEAVSRLDGYVRQEGFTADDRVDYVYSLAWYMWKHGRLTEDVRRRAFHLMDSGAGLELYDDAGMRRQREKVLAQFRNMLDSPQPQAMPIRVRLNLKPVFQVGDAAVWRLQTANGPYIRHDDTHWCPETLFRKLDGWWMLLRKVRDDISWQSRIVPEVRDIWPVWEVYDVCSPEPPSMEELRHSRVIGETAGAGTMAGYRRHQVKVIGNDRTGISPEDRPYHTGQMLFLSAGQPADYDEVQYLWNRGSCLRKLAKKYDL